MFLSGAHNDIFLVVAVFAFFFYSSCHSRVAGIYPACGLSEISKKQFYFWILLRNRYPLTREYDDKKRIAMAAGESRPRSF
jgi:hypothetical protein